MKCSEVEVWVNMLGYEGLYSISTFGNIKNKKGLVLTSKANKKGYFDINLSKCGIKRTHKIHREVAINFISNPFNLPEVNHIDGNKANNFKSNLEWTTSSGNQKHAFKIGLQVSQKGSKHGIAKLTEEKVLEIRKLYDGGGITQKQLSIYFNISFSIIHAVVRRKLWKHV